MNQPPETRGDAPAELDLDPFERIELTAAAWRNAYRAFERGDRIAVVRHASEAAAHGWALWRGIIGA